MSRFIRSCVISFLFIGNCFAHDGLENETEIRVRKDRIEVTVRSSYIFVWRLLGDQAPADANDASLEKVKPQLRVIGKNLIEITTNNKPLELRSVDVVFELGKHAAFTYIYPMPAGHPQICFRALFFKNLGDLEEGNFRLIDLTQDPRRRDAEPLARKRLHKVDASFSFSTADDGIKILPDPPAVTTPVRQSE